MHSGQLTTHPSVPTETWTQISTVAGYEGRGGILVVNENSSVNYRVEACSEADAESLTATSGVQLTPGGHYSENEIGITAGHVYAYQASGGTLTTLAVKENL